jgi:hypothetical protein
MHSPAHFNEKQRLTKLMPFFADLLRCKLSLHGLASCSSMGQPLPKVNTFIAI